MTRMKPRGPRPVPHDGDKDAFAAFYHATAKRIYWLAYRMTGSDRELASDVTQEAYLAMWLEWPQRQCLSHDVNRWYVRGILVKKVADWYRKRKMFVELDEEMDVYSIEEDLVDRLDERAVWDAVLELLKVQPPRRRVVATLHFIEKMEYAEIAQALGITESTVRTQVERFLGQLKPLRRRFTDTNRGGERS